MKGHRLVPLKLSFGIVLMYDEDQSAANLLERGRHISLMFNETDYMFNETHPILNETDPVFRKSRHVKVKAELIHLLKVSQKVRRNQLFSQLAL